MVLAAVALWIGRPLLPKAVENFWHLHYTLVFPVFVALREILRSIAEQFSGQTATPEQLDRRRRLGTVLGALLFAGGGLALAITVDLSIGLQLVDVERVRPWAVIRAALGNAAVVLGLSTAAESLYWVWRELRFRGRVLDWAPGPSEPGTSIDRVAHLSDLHFVGERYGCRMESGTHGPRGNRCIRRALRKLAAIHASSPLDRVLVTGDVTDAGTRAEWAEFIDLLRRLPRVTGSIVICAGKPRRKHRRPQQSGALRFALERRVSRYANSALSLPWMRSRATAPTWSTGRPARSDHRYRTTCGKAAAPNACVRSRNAARCRDGVRCRRSGTRSSRWSSLRPGEDGYGLILLNSNARSHFSLTNAIGVVNPSQLNALKSILRGSPRSAWMILLHHQVVEYPVASISLTDRIGLALVNAPDVLAAIAPHASRCLVLHGHRHRDWIGTCQDVVLCSAPSVTMGSQWEKCRGSFHVHEFAIGAGGSMRLTATERVKVS